MITQIARENLSYVSGGGDEKVADIVPLLAGIGGGIGASAQLTAAGGWAAFGTLGVGFTTAALGGLGASFAAGAAVGTAIGNTDVVRDNLSAFFGWVANGFSSTPSGQKVKPTPHKK